MNPLLSGRKGNVSIFIRSAAATALYTHFFFVPLKIYFHSHEMNEKSWIEQVKFFLVVHFYHVPGILIVTDRKLNCVVSSCLQCICIIFSSSSAFTYIFGHNAYTTRAMLKLIQFSLSHSGFSKYKKTTNPYQHCCCGRSWHSLSPWMKQFFFSQLYGFFLLYFLLRKTCPSQLSNPHEY